MLKKIHVANINSYLYLAESLEDSYLLLNLEKKQIKNYSQEINENTKFHFVNELAVVKHGIIQSYPLKDCDIVIIPNDIYNRTISVKKLKNGKPQYLQTNELNTGFVKKPKEDYRLATTGWITKYNKEELELLEQKKWMYYDTNMVRLTFLCHDITLTQEDFIKMQEVKDLSIRSFLTLNYNKSLFDLMLLKFLLSFNGKSYQPIYYVPAVYNIRQLATIFEKNNIKIPEWVLTMEYEKHISKLVKGGEILKPLNKPQWYV